MVFNDTKEGLVLPDWGCPVGPESIKSVLDELIRSTVNAQLKTRHGIEPVHTCPLDDKPTQFSVELVGGEAKLEVLGVRAEPDGVPVLADAGQYGKDPIISTQGDFELNEAVTGANVTAWRAAFLVSLCNLHENGGSVRHVILVAVLDANHLCKHGKARR